jgi:hypothetical protein
MIAKVKKGAVFHTVEIYSDFGKRIEKFEQVGFVYYDAEEVKLSSYSQQTFQISTYRYIKIGNAVLLKS